VAAAAVLDVDGTLVDTTYQHTLCWYRAFRERGVVVPAWRLHRHVGMGADKFVEAVAGPEVEREHGDGLRERWEELFDGMLAEIVALEGARELVLDLKDRGLTVVLASSAIASHLERFLDVLDVRELADSWTGKDDVERSKPDPDLVETALRQAGTRDAVMVGDTPWDVESALKAGIPTIGVRTGGYSGEELLGAGAAAVYDSVAELRGRLDEALGRRRVG
jgi:HAD superfamily hydrolase (TIGR01509 family)